MTIHYQDDRIELHLGRAATIARDLTPSSVRCIVTSPPYYGLRDYGVEGQIGNEPTLRRYVKNLVSTFRALKPSLTADGTLWLNLGDTYAGKANRGPAYSGNRGRGRPGVMPARSNTTSDAPYKNLLLVPARVALALQADGWVLRADVIWAKPNPMPESVTDRPTRSHEHLFMFTKSSRYLYNADAIREADSGQDHARKILEGQPSLEPSGGLRTSNSGIRSASGRNGEGRNKRDVWTISPSGFPGAHFATYPEELVRPCILASSDAGDTVLDPFSGSGTTGKVALHNGRNYIGIDVNRVYLDLSLKTRFHQPPLSMETTS